MNGGEPASTVVTKESVEVKDLGFKKKLKMKTIIGESSMEHTSIY
jgi:hypothetical protein